MLLGELRRWGLAPEVVERLLPHADRALDWITDFGDRDGDGYVEYQRATDRGERHQAWKDSADPVRLPDGTPARGPLALAEVQAYVYAAYLARAHFAAEAGDEPLAAAVARAGRRAAGGLQPGLLGGRGGLAGAGARRRQAPGRRAGLERRPLPLERHRRRGQGRRRWSSTWWPTTCSRGGACARWARRWAPTTRSGRTRGAVWPHDNALCVAGLVRYGFVDEAHRLVLAQLEAAEASGGRMAVLCGFDRDDVAGPVRLPDGCDTRAWSAAAPLLHLRSLLRLDPYVPQGKLWLSPVLPDAIRSLRVERIPLMGASVTVTVEDGVGLGGGPSRRHRGRGRAPPPPGRRRLTRPVGRRRGTVRRRGRSSTRTT